MDGSRGINHPRLNWNLIKGSPLLCRAVAKLVLTSRLESTAWKICCENSSRNTVPSDADSRAATFFNPPCGENLFSVPPSLPRWKGTREEDTTWSRNDDGGARGSCVVPPRRGGVGRGAVVARLESKASGEWPISVASSGSNNVGYYINQGEKTKFSLSVFSR